jgi:hypothetical protein
VTEAHQPVVEMVLVGLGRAHPTTGSADDSERRVENRYPEDKERDQNRGEEEEGPAAEILVGLADDRHRRRRHEQSEQQSSGVAHEDPGRVEVVG